MSEPLENGCDVENTAADPLATAFGDAQAAAERGDWPAAIEAGELAVELTRNAGENDVAQRTLSVMLYNLGTFYAQAERFDDAVGALEEVVTLDERTGNEDLEADRQTLEHARTLASMSPEERAEVQRQKEEMAKHLEDMSPEERAAVQEQARQAEIEHIVEAVQQQALAVLRGEREVGQAIEHLRVAADQASGDEALGDAREDLAGYFTAVAAVLAGETPSAVPATYATQIAELREQSS